MPAVEASVYSLNAWLKSGKAVMGLVVSKVLSLLKAAWHSALQWKTTSFLVRACKRPAIAAKFFT